MLFTTRLPYYTNIMTSNITQKEKYPENQMCFEVYSEKSLRITALDFKNVIEYSFIIKYAFHSKVLTFYL